MLRELVTAFAIVAICLVIHVFAIVFMAEWLLRRRDAAPGDDVSTLGYALLLLAVFSAIILLHVAQTGIWAGLYYERSLFPDYETSLYFSLVSYTTIGYGDVVLPQRWRLLGGIEGVSGTLLCGLSTAFIFAIINAMFQMRLRQRSGR
jgi:voltage-gated potassium channel Kch